MLIFPLMFGGLAGVVGLLFMADATDYSSRGQAVDAEIVSTQLDRSRGPGSGNNHEIPTATVRFLVSGEEIFAASRISPELYEKAQPGDVVRILYLPENPRQIEIEAGTNLQAALILGAVAAAALACWLLVLFRSARFARQAVLVRDTGSRSEVTVTEHKEPLFSSNGKPTTRLSWRDGAGKERHSLPLPADRAARYPVGREIMIYELPDGDLPSVWEGDVQRI